MNRINLDRPYICREDGSAGPGSFPIYMYKDEPGVYRKQNGQPAEDRHARSAGFDLPGDRLLARMDEKRAAALSKIEQEFEGQKSDIEKEARAEIAAEDEAEKKSLDDAPVAADTTGGLAADGVIMNSNGEPRETATRKMNHLGAGYWEVVDKETGNQIKDGLDKVHAQIILMEA